MAFIYVSSTKNDLDKCREQVSRVIRRMGHTDVAMEYYVAENQRPVDRCLADVAHADLYIGIFAWRYGWVPPTDNPQQRSITELEYREARKLGKPCLLFLLHPDAPWPKSAMESLPRIEALRAELEESMVGYFTSADDIAGVVAPALHRWAVDRGLRTASLDEFTLKRYFDHLRTRYRHMDLDAMTPPERDEHVPLQLRSLFVEQSVREMLPPVDVPKDLWLRLQREREVGDADFTKAWDKASLSRLRESYAKAPKEAVIDAILRPANIRSVILGDPGSGKSTLIRYLTLALIDPEPTSRIATALPGWLPLPIELKTYVALKRERQCANFLEFWDHQSRAYSWDVSRTQLEHHLDQNGQALVLFDGLDEVFQPEERTAVAEQIAAFAARYPKIRTLVTSRVIGYQRHTLEDAGFRHFTLQDLDRTQVEKFIGDWYRLAMADRPEDAKLRRDRILRTYEATPAIQQLAGNPLLLTIMAIIGKHQELPRERWKLYEHAAEVLVHHWDAAHNRAQLPGCEDFGVEDKKRLLERLAARMQQGAGGLAGNYVHQDEVAAVFEEAFRARGLTPLESIKIAKVFVQQFRERNFILAWYGGSLFGFVHRGLLEYFCAKEVVRRCRAGELTQSGLREGFFRAHAADSSWHEPLRLICAMLEDAWANGIVQFLAGDTVLRRQWSALSLAVRCLEDHRYPQSLSASTELLGSLCRQILRDPQTDFARLVRGVGARWADRDFLKEWAWLAAEAVRRTPKGVETGRFLGITGAAFPDLARGLQAILRAKSGWSRLFAASALAEQAGTEPEGRAVLVQLAQGDASEGVRRSAASALAAQAGTEPEGRAVLVQLAQGDASENVRVAAATALAEQCATEPEGRAVLVQLVQRDASVFVRVSAAMALAEKAGTEPEVRAVLLQLAQGDASEYVRVRAARMLAKQAGTEPEVRAVLQQLAQGAASEDVRVEAARALAEKAGTEPEGRAVLLQLAHGAASGHVRVEAARALAERAGTEGEGRAVLLQLAQSAASEYVRVEAASALAEQAGTEPEVRAVLLQLAQGDASEFVRVSAAMALAEKAGTEPEARAALLQLAQGDASEYVRVEAARVLAAQAGTEPEGRAVLLQLSQGDASEYVRVSAAMALAEKAGTEPEVRAVLLQLAQGSASEDVRFAAAMALAEQAGTDAEVRAVLLQLAQGSASEDVRFAAAMALAESPEVFDAFAREYGIQDSSHRVRYYAVCALAARHLHDPEVRERLRRLSTTDPDDLIRIRLRFAFEDEYSPWKRWLTGADPEDPAPTTPPAIRIQARWLSLRNIRGFEDSGEMEITDGSCLLVGANAAGKSTLLRCLALAALGPELANQVERRAASYLRHGAEEGYIEAVFRLEMDGVEPEEFAAGLRIRAGESAFQAIPDEQMRLAYQNCAPRLDVLRRRSRDDFGFLCAYGSLRMFSDPATLESTLDRPMLDRVRPLFEARAPVVDPDVLAKLLSGDLSNFRGAPPGLPKEIARKMCAQLADILPDCGVPRVPIAGSLPLLGGQVPLRDLSDGYASLLALVGHLLRHALEAGEWKVDPTAVHGMVLIDEVDAHLHPAWQRRVLPDLQKVFPNLQIVATTHSPMVVGSVAPVSIRLLRREGGAVKVSADVPDVEHWRADQILTSVLFDLPTTRSEKAQRLLHDYADRLERDGPDDPEVRRMAPEVARAMELPGEGPVDTATHQLLDRVLEEKFRALDPEQRKLVLAKAGLVLREGKA